MKRPTVVLAYNVGPRPIHKIARSVRGIEPARTAKVTALFEASHPALVTLLRARYPLRRVICHRSDAVALLRRGARKPRVEVIHHAAPWRGPHLGRFKRGRRWLLLVWDDEAVLLIHRVTPKHNDAARREETRLIRSVLERTDLPENLAIVGDHNADADDLRREYAGLDAELVAVNAKVDHALVRGYDADESTGTRLGNHGSDHVAILWRLVTRRAG